MEIWLFYINELGKFLSLLSNVAPYVYRISKSTLYEMVKKMIPEGQP